MAERPWQQPRPWDRLPDESEIAHAQFRVFLTGDVNRSIVDAARKVGRSERQLHKQASRHRWRERARAYDIAMAHAEDEGELARRQARQRRREEMIEWAERAAWARIRRVVREDPVTGELTFENSFGVREALAVLRRTIEALPGEPPEEEGPVDATSRLRGLSSQQLDELCRFISERTKEEGDVETQTAEEQQPADGPQAGGGEQGDE